MNDEIMADSGDLKALAEFANQLAADFGLRVAVEGAGQSRVVRRFLRGEFSESSIAGEHDDFVIRHGERRSFQRASRDVEPKERLGSSRFDGKEHEHGQ